LGDLLILKKLTAMAKTLDELRKKAEEILFNRKEIQNQNWKRGWPILIMLKSMGIL